MSDIGAGGRGGEVDISGGMNFQPRGRQTWFQKQIFGKQGITGSVQASLKFDIPGLKDFRTELEAIRKVLDSLDASFKKISTSPLAWATNLKKVNDELRQLRGNQGALGSPTAPGAPIPIPGVGPAQNAPGGGFSPGTAGGMLSAFKGAGGGRAGISAAMGEGGGGAAAIGAITAAIAQGMDMAFKRFDRTMDMATSSDVYASRLAPMTGVRAQAQFSALGRSGGQPFFGSMEEITRARLQGAVVGAIPGTQRGQAFETGIMQMQQMMPGMGAQQAAGTYTAAIGNVAGQKRAMGGMFGMAGAMYKRGGGLKTPAEYFGGILQRLESMPRRNGTRGKWSKESLEAQMMPGSTIDMWLDEIGMAPDMKEQFWAYAIDQAQYGTGFQATQTQMEQIRGKSIATAAQETDTRRGRREAAEAARQYDNILTRQDREQQVIGALQRIDDKMSSVVGLLGGNVPGALQGKITGALAGAGAGAATGALIGSVVPGLGTGVGAIVGGLAGGLGGLMGDPEGSLSHLSPDLRDRVGAMMAANPNLSITSAYRDNLRQEQLQGSGRFAPSGQSKHGRGMAIDIGPPEELGWLAANARDFGLDTAGHMGEPWHVQLAGSMGFMGDPPDDRRLRGLMASSAMRWGAMQAAAAASAASGGPAANAAGTGVTDTGASPSMSAGGAIVPGGAGGTLTAEQMVKLAYDAGFRGQNLIDIVGIAYRESKWNPGAYNPNAKTADLSFGLTQINMLGNLGPSRIKQFGITKNEDLYDPAVNMKSAYILSGGGTNLSPWGAYKGKSNTYNVPQSALDQARAAAKAAGYIGDPFGRGGGGGSIVSKPVSFNNTFHITMSGNANAGDVDAVVRKIASRLEVQVRRTVSRTN